MVETIDGRAVFKQDAVGNPVRVEMRGDVRIIMPKRAGRPH